MAGIRIDELDQTLLQSRDHVVPAMKDGMTVQLSVAQILSRLLRDDLAGKLLAADVAFDPGTGGPLVAEDVQAAIEEMLAQLVGTFPQTLTAPQQAQARGNIGVDEWRFKAIFEPFPLLIDPDIDVALMPPKLRGAGDAIYVLLSANKAGVGQYNEDILINQSVSGSGALVQATAEIYLPGSPKHSATIHLMNTEQRFLRAGEAGGIPQQDAMQRITGGNPTGAGKAWHGDASIAVNDAHGAVKITSAGDRATVGTAGNRFFNWAFDSGNSPGARVSDEETRVKNQSAVYFMRVQ